MCLNALEDRWHRSQGKSLPFFVGTRNLQTDPEQPAMTFAPLVSRSSSHNTSTLAECVFHNCVATLGGDYPQISNNYAIVDRIKGLILHCAQRIADSIYKIFLASIISMNLNIGNGPTRINRAPFESKISAHVEVSVNIKNT